MGGMRTKSGFLASCVECVFDNLLMRLALRREGVAKGFGTAWSEDRPRTVARVDVSRVKHGAIVRRFLGSFL